MNWSLKTGERRQVKIRGETGNFSNEIMLAVKPFEIKIHHLIIMANANIQN